MHTLTHTVRKYFMVISVFNFLNYSFIKWYNPVWGRNIIQPFCIYYDCHTQSPYGPFCCDKRSSSLLNVRPGAWCVQFNNWRWTDKAHCIILRHVTCYLHLYSFIFTSLLSRQTGIWLLIWDGKWQILSETEYEEGKKVWGSCLIKAESANHKNV